MDENTYKARILLGVWGENFIENFLEFSLPSLLAPGNIPALAAELPLTFVFLTRPFDIPVFENSAAVQHLKKYCEVEYISIRDLIVFGNHSTTLTYSFDRAIRQTGADMLKTYFIFLTSDYIMADGSLQGLMRYIKKGYSGIFAGNFQVIKEEIEPILKKRVDPVEGVIRISPRDLVNYSIPYLHPVTIASIINQEALHNYKANRFFVTEGMSIIAGRFYLLHMLCIKPETMDYKVGASCDYSFMPEMCPSGNVAIINDSDDYLVVEAQPKAHELNYVMWGQYKQRYLLTALQEWTTEQHRANSRETIYYHGNELLPEQKASIEKQFDQMIGRVNEKLNKYPAQPFFNHPYWQGATKSFEDERLLISQHAEYDFVNYMAVHEGTSIRKYYHLLFGLPPKVFPWHYRWLEYKRVMEKVQSMLVSAKAGRTLVLYGCYIQDFIRYRNWFAADYTDSDHYFLPAWLREQHGSAYPSLEQYQNCVLMIRLEDMKDLRDVLFSLKKQLPDHADVLLVIPNENRAVTNIIFDFLREIARRMNSLVGTPYRVAKITPINSNMSLLGAVVIKQIGARFSFSRNVRLVIFALLAVPSALFISAANLLNRVLSKKGHCTNVIVNLTPKSSGECNG